MQSNSDEPGKSNSRFLRSSQGNVLNEQDIGAVAPEGVTSQTDESSSLVSSADSLEFPDLPPENTVKDHAHRVDIRGLKLLPMVEFWQLFSLMGILTGIGLMTIK